MSITIEQESSRTTRCDCCGGTTTKLTRFVYRDGDAYAAYVASYSENHQDGIVRALIGLGAWGEGASLDQRTAFAVEMRVMQGEYQVMVTDAGRSPWRDTTELGRIVGREEALAHPLCAQVFHLTDHIVHEDKEIHSFLERAAG